MAKPKPGRPPVACDLCGRQFKDRSGLSGHMRLVHGGYRRGGDSSAELDGVPTLQAWEALVKRVSALEDAVGLVGDWEGGALRDGLEECRQRLERLEGGSKGLQRAVAELEGRVGLVFALVQDLLGKVLADEVARRVYGRV